ncbi:hypothetical protein KTO58_19695 [Chitinophaga pendula]|uniref:hypothetical protein n=1 Tax=Chitinophaga TaxID=79328 RepID=UPI000BB09CC1|nr:MULTISPECIES: hypothetical protein [Chitinophaga]ASZ11108.1 hypothetical protein CK934_09105 [Chitinophaga sp. MD30]UCJ05894.1 hypothetical protein KTO58_19695 [Chitinophaga pendula]
MKTLLLLLLMGTLQAQSRNDLKDVILSGKIKEFVTGMPKHTEIDDLQHPLVNYHINRGLLKPDRSLFGVPIKEIFAFEHNNGRTSLYIIFEIDDAKLDAVTGGLGKPLNVSEEELKSRDFDMLFWDLPSGFNVDLRRNYYADEDTGTAGIASTVKVIISNAEHSLQTRELK